MNTVVEIKNLEPLLIRNVYGFKNNNMYTLRVFKFINYGKNNKMEHVICVKNTYNANTRVITTKIIGYFYPTYINYNIRTYKKLTGRLLNQAFLIPCSKFSLKTYV